MEQAQNYATQPPEQGISQEDIQALAVGVADGSITPEELQKSVPPEVAEQVMMAAQQGQGGQQAPQQPQGGQQDPQQGGQGQVDPQIQQIAEAVNSGEITIEEVAQQDPQLAEQVKQLLGGSQQAGDVGGASMSTEEIHELAGMFLEGKVTEEQLKQLPPADQQALQQVLQAQAQ